MEPTPAEVAAAELHAVIGVVKSGSLRVFGDWFGRPRDNHHVVRSVHAEGHDLVVEFEENEQLRISSPAEWRFDTHAFRVQHARRVVWCWYYYGRPQTPENLFTQEHWIDDKGDVRARSDVDWYEPKFRPSATHPAVDLL